MEISAYADRYKTSDIRKRQNTNPSITRALKKYRIE